MSEKRKKKKNGAASGGVSYGDNKSRPNRKEKLKRLGLLVLSSILFFGFYTGCNRLRLGFVVYLYFGALLVLLPIFIILNRGIDSKLPEYDELPDGWTDGEKTDYLERESKKRAIARKLIYVIIPILLTFGIDIVYLNFFAQGM